MSMTRVGYILDEFFSPLSSEKLWVMPENDEYTERVRKWRPVIDAVGRIKADLSAKCATWAGSYKTNSSWKPVMSDAPKAGAHREFVQSPPGTDPQTCA